MYVFFSRFFFFFPSFHVILFLVHAIFYLQVPGNPPKPVNDVYEMHPGVTFKENLLLNDIELNAPRGDIKLVNLNSTNCNCGELDLAPNGNFEFKPDPGWYTNPLAVGDCSI